MTVVIPVRDHDPRATLDALGPVGAVVVVDDGSVRPVAGARRDRASPRPAPRPRGGAHDGRGRRDDAAGGVRRRRLRAPPGLARSAPGPLRRRAGGVRRAPGRQPGRRRRDGPRRPRPLRGDPQPARPRPGRGPHRARHPHRVRAGRRGPRAPSRRSRQVGGFDPSLRVGEDVDLVWRLVEAGWRARYEPQSVVGHRPRATLAALLRQRFGYGRSAGALDRRHPGARGAGRHRARGRRGGGPWPARATRSAGALLGLTPAVAVRRALPAVDGRDALGAPAGRARPAAGR